MTSAPSGRRRFVGYGAKRRCDANRFTGIDHMIWTLQIKLLSGRWAEKDWAATIALDASSTLEDLHHIIQQAVGFDNDHLYGFYVARTPWSRDRVRYDGSVSNGWYDEDDEGDDEDDAGKRRMPGTRTMQGKKRM